LPPGLDRRAVDRSNETIAIARNGLDESRAIGGIAKRLPQLSDRGVQAVVEADERVCRPEALPQLVARDDGTASIQEQGERVEWLVLQVYPSATLSEFAGLDVQLENTKPDDRAAGTEPLQ
jgi:hypothetical protein